MAGAVAGETFTPLDAPGVAGDRAGDLILCEDCPVFSSVPATSPGDREVAYVSKFELTWQNYLASVDDGECGLPTLQRSSPSSQSDIVNNIDLFRIAWPVTKLNDQEIGCYINWLQSKTDFTVALPAPDEWEWFARAGLDGVRYPWGNEPEAGREAVGRTDIDVSAQRPWPFEQGGSLVNRHMDGVRVGQFAPNNWGLYDVLGNVREITSEVISGDEFIRRNGETALSRMLANQSRVIVKGSTWWIDANWEPGIAQERYLIISEGTYSAPAGVRLILVSTR